MRTIDINTMARHYLIAAKWADGPEGQKPRWTNSAKIKAHETCGKFAGLIVELWPEILEHPDYWAHPDCGGMPEAALGHDLWLTCRGHGVGFWDRDTLPEKLRAKLDALCGWRKAIPEPDLYAYRGWFYL